MVSAADLCFCFGSRTIAVSRLRFAMPPKKDSKAGEPSEMEEPAAEVQQGKPPKSKAKAKAKATAMKLQPMKFSAKAKAKVQAKAKAKATAKAKAKSSSAPGAMKRPSSSGHSVHDLKDNIEKTTTQEAQDGAQHRDKGKGIKYQRQKADLPGYVVALIEEETKKSSSPGAAKTNLINKLYRKEKDGTLSLQLSDPTFAEAQKVTWHCYSSRFLWVRGFVGCQT